jgi:hypothetical protein
MINKKDNSLIVIFGPERYFMKKIILFIILVLVCRAQGFSQLLTDSNLPIVVINTDGGVYIPDNPRVLATMKIIYRGPGERNYLSDIDNTLYLNYNGRISIEIRGSSSQDLEKKSYGLTTLLDDDLTEYNVKLLGMPKENDWILNSLNFEPSCIRDYLSYYLSRQIEEYASRTVYCEVVVNGDYRGLYLLEEKIKSDKNRVNIEKITTTDNSLPELSGGYITKADKANGDPIAWTMYSYNGQSVDYINDWPKPEEATTTQTNYIKGEFVKLETDAHSMNTSLSSGYPSIIDIPSFIDYMLLSELASNPDSYEYSTYFHKDRNGKLRAGPIWDFNLSFGNDLFIYGFDRSKTNVWQFNDNSGNNGSKFWQDLFSISSFKCNLSKRWNYLTGTGQPFDVNMISTFIDQTVATISEAVTRDEARWAIIVDYAEEIKGIKTFINARETWITSNIGSYSACSNVSVPPLVISKIMYSPKKITGLYDADDLEFIQITNNSNEIINLNGIYFSGTGLVYQFPMNMSLKANGSLYLASDSIAFKKVYGLVPFGQYTRNLSDKSQKIVLSTAYGNVIDSLTYTDSSPWPYADGNGYYLDLIDLSFDNSLAESWVASSFTSTPVNNPEEDPGIRFMPNPVHTLLVIESQSEINNIKMYDMNGTLLLSETVGCEKHDIDMTRYKPGIYMFRVETTTGTTTQKIVKY